MLLEPSIFSTGICCDSKPASDILDNILFISELDELTSIIVNLTLIYLNFFLKSFADFVNEFIVLNVYSDLSFSKILFLF